MKKRFLLLALLLGMSACTAKTEINIDGHIDIKDYTTTKTGELGSFNLLGPSDNMVVENVKTFSWEESTNAVKYSLEICSSSEFISDIDTIDYYIAKNITATSFNINSEFEFRDTTYYWRVTAFNDANTTGKKCNEVFDFFVKAPEVNEVHFDLGEADDWTLHPLGSYADVSVDNTDFFKNGEESIKLQFKQEDTNQGKPESDGWIIVTKTIEKSIYGTDALFFNMYYAGQQADVIIRLVDRDNEYWYAPALISNNAKQSVILKFDEFKQRTGDVTVANMKFDYERIKYLEIVFEKTFGDGVFLISGMKAIKFSNYRNFFIDTLNFEEYNASEVAFDNYTYDVTFNQTEAILHHYGVATDDYAKINGYGFLTMKVNRYFVTGDAIRLKIKRTGSIGSNVIIRLYEEDTDRWSYKFPYNTLTEEYQEVIIPYGAFAASSLMGDGRRQFYKLLNIQFGCEGQYGDGYIYFKDFEIITLKDTAPITSKVVGSDGMVDDFNNYKFNADIFRVWEHSEGNKDEYMVMNSSNKIGGKSNPYSCQFEYKSDMEEALYYIPITTSFTFDGFSIWMKDGSVKPGETKVDHVQNWSPTVRLLIQLKTNEIYQYVIDPLPTIWNEFNVNFADFTLTNDKELKVPANPIVGNNIQRIGFAFKYFYYTADNIPLPMYSMQNPVYVDNVRLTNDTVTSVIPKDIVINMEDGVSKFDDFEGYNSSNELQEAWLDGRDYDYQKITLSNDVSSEGGNHSMALQYKSHSDSVSYYFAPAVSKGVSARAVVMNLKSEKPATVYFNIYLNISGSTQQYRATIDSVASSWTEYKIGFNHFTVVSGTAGRKLLATDMQYISRITFGVVYNGDASATLYELNVDNVRFDNNLTYSVWDTRSID